MVVAILVLKDVEEGGAAAVDVCTIVFELVGQGSA